MKKIVFSAMVALSLLGCDKKQDSTVKSKYEVKQIGEKYKYEIVQGDATNTRMYKLENGLTVYLSVYKDAPRIQTYIPIRAGSKNDPADATGLAHYLEHLMFKGTSKIGALDWEKEKPLLDEIEALYEKYRATTDAAERKAIYKQIDEVSGRAAKFATANEYDKMVSNIGAKGTNAFTSFDQTAYVNDIPSNQLEKWLELEAERFQEIVPRLFHTELEAVYEEKNRSLDNDGSKVFEKVFELTFPKHQYGTQTTIGTIDHLKNPSIVKIKEYFYKNYVPNNMAICLAGDLDPDKTIELIDKYFGKMEYKAMEPFNIVKEEPLKENIEATVYGPDAENLMMAFKLPNKLDKEVPALQLLNQMLYNGQAGLIDVNINQKQKALDAYSFQYLLNDYSIHLLMATAREGQELSEVKDLLLEQLDSIKAGNFNEWMLAAAINNLKIAQMRSMESNRGRAGAMMDAFISHQDWLDRVCYLDNLSNVTKQDVIDVANKYFKNYVCVYKKIGEDPNKLQVEKPQITKIEVNRDSTSVFYKSFMTKEAAPVAPQFLDYTQIDKNVINGYNFMHKTNADNEIFDLYYLVDMGKNNNPKLALAINYLEYLGTNKYSLEELNKEFYKLGSKYYVYTSEDQVYVRLTGLQSSFDKSIELFEHLLAEPKGDEEALQNMIAGEMKYRSDAKLDKQNILYSGLYNYAMYGEKNPFNNVLTDEQLKSITVEEMIALIKSVMSFEHNVLYYGPSEMNEIEAKIKEKHSVPAQLKPLPTTGNFVQKDVTQPTVYWTNYDMVQAEMLILSKTEQFNVAKLPIINLYNDYFGGGMGSIVFQEMREAKALAYSVWSRYGNPRKKEESHIIMSYIGTQSDKLPEAITGMYDLLDNMPESELAFQNSKTAIKNKIETERITKSAVLFNYLAAQKLGLDYDVRKDVYAKVDGFTLEEIRNFQQEMVKGRTRNIAVIGSKDKLDFKTLSKYGVIKEVSLEQLFGY